jgi:hypothetical protein
MWLVCGLCVANVWVITKNQGFEFTFIHLLRLLNNMSNKLNKIWVGKGEGNKG